MEEILESILVDFGFRKEYLKNGLYRPKFENALKAIENHYWEKYNPPYKEIRVKI